MKDDALTTGALFVGAGVAGYAVGKVVLSRWLTARAAATPTPAAAATSTPPAQARPSPIPTRPTRPREPAPPREPDVGPVRSPSEVETPAISSESSEAPPDHRPSRRFDRIFDMYRESIPIEYLRALSQRESGMNPEEAKGPAWGLMQIVEVVRKDYNERNGTKYTRQDLLDPAINVAICCWLLRFIIAAYQKHHADIPNMRADWSNPRFVELLTFGWNAGFSSSGGVIKVVRYLKNRGHTDVTMDLVHKHARAAGASRHLSNVKKVRWCRSVVRLYEQETAAPITYPV